MGLSPSATITRSPIPTGGIPAFHQHPLQGALHPGKPWLLFGLNGPDENRGQAGQSAGHHIGKDLVAHHGGPFTVETKPAEAGQTAKGEGFEGYRDPRQFESLGQGPDPPSAAVGKQTQTDPRPAKPVEPFEDLRAKIGRAITLERAIDVQHQRVQSHVPQPRQVEFQNALDAKMGRDNPEHGSSHFVQEFRYILRAAGNGPSAAWFTSPKRERGKAD